LLRAGDSPQADTKLVDLNVVALDNHGQPVKNLTADDFQIFDAGKKQKITLFRANSSDAGTEAPLRAHEFSNRSGSTITHATVILFDLMNEGFATRGVATSKLTQALESLDSADDVYLYLLTVEGRLFAVHGITGEEAQGAAWTREIRPLMDRAMRMVVRNRPVDIDVAARAVLTYRALAQLAGELSTAPGRKDVVWISDGVPLALGPGRSDTGGYVDFTPLLRQLSGGFERSRVAIYPARQVILGGPDGIGDTSGSGATGGEGTGVQSLATLNQFAALTGGRQDGGKNIGGAIRQAMSDLRFSYQIGYYQPAASRDGKFHKLRIECSRKGVRILAKTGYYAWRDAPGSATEQAIQATAPLPFDATEIGLRGSLAPEPKDTSALRVDVRIDANDVAFAEKDGEYIGQLRVAVVAYRADGLVDTTPAVPLELKLDAQEHDEALREGIPFSQSMRPRGAVSRLRVIAYDRGSNAVGSLTMPVKQPAP